MIPVIELVMSLRYALGDMQGLNVSDYELIEPINQAASLLYGRLSERFVHAVVKRKHGIEIDPNSDEEAGSPPRVYALPSDFVRIHQVLGALPEKTSDGGEKYGADMLLVPTSMNPPAKGSYRIVGSELYAPKGQYTIEYYYIPTRVRSLGDNLDVPEGMRSWIEQISLAMYKKDMNTSVALIQQAESVLAGREISHFENTGPAQVLGGRV